MLQAKLIVVGGEVKTQEVKLKLPTIIGRGKEANLKVPLALISRVHCEIRERDGRLYIRDLGSTNGTFVNNYKITSEQPLLPGELVTVGSVTFRADYQLSSKPTAEPQKRLASGREAHQQQPQMAEGADEIIFSPVVANRGRDRVLEKNNRVSGKKVSATASAMDATVAGTMSLSVSPGRPVELSEAKSPAPPQTSATAVPPSVVSATPLPEAGPAHQKQSPAGASPALAALRDQHDVLEDFPLEATPEKSISLSALDELRFNAPRQVSFIGDLSFGEASPAPANEPVQIDLGKKKEAAAVMADEKADAQLDSFLRRIAQPSE